MPVNRNVTSEGGIDGLLDVGEHPGLNTQLNSSSYDSCDNLRKAVRIRRFKTVDGLTWLQNIGLGGTKNHIKSAGFYSTTCRDGPFM